jgi:hypothetical protein
VNPSTPGLDLVEDAISDGLAAIGWDESMARRCEILETAMAYAVCRVKARHPLAGA